MTTSSENQPRRNEEHEGFFWFFLRSLRFFVVDSHGFWASLIANERLPGDFWFKDGRNGTLSE
jgi:hypothetical protein